MSTSLWRWRKTGRPVTCPTEFDGFSFREYASPVDTVKQNLIFSSPSPCFGTLVCCSASSLPALAPLVHRLTSNFKCCRWPSFAHRPQMQLEDLQLCVRRMNVFGGARGTRRPWSVQVRQMWKCGSMVSRVGAPLRTWLFLKCFSGGLAKCTRFPLFS